MTNKLGQLKFEKLITTTSQLQSVRLLQYLPIAALGGGVFPKLKFQNVHHDMMY